MMVCSQQHGFCVLLLSDDWCTSRFAEVPSLWALWRGAAAGMHATDDQADAYQSWRRKVGVSDATPGRVDIPEERALSY